MIKNFADLDLRLFIKKLPLFAPSFFVSVLLFLSLSVFVSPSVSPFLLAFFFLVLVYKIHKVNSKSKQQSKRKCNCMMNH